MSLLSLDNLTVQRGDARVVDGVSLTVNSVEDQADGSVHFGLNIIPHTWEATTLGALKPGDAVNLEIDMLARYLARWQETA